MLQEQWACDLAVRIQEMRHLLLMAMAERKTSCEDSTVYGEAARAVDHLLKKAEDAIQRPQKWRHGRSLLDHWRGLTVVTAYESVHAAEVFLVDLLSDDQIRMRVPSVVARAQIVLAAEDPRRQDVDRLQDILTQQVAGGSVRNLRGNSWLRRGPAVRLTDNISEQTLSDELCRVHFKEAMRASFQAEDRIYLRIRSFRNLVVKCTLLLFVLVAAMVWLVAAHPRSMPLCFSPGTTSAATNAMPTICPSGDNTPPSSNDIMIISGLGLIGSAVAAAFSIRTVHGMPTPYDIPVALAFFKLPLGALTAVTGLLLLGGNFVPGLSELDNQRQILAYALAFGYAQQLISRMVDDRARSIIGQLPNASPSTSAKPT